MSQFLKCCVPWLRQKSFDAIWLDKGAERERVVEVSAKNAWGKKNCLTPAFLAHTGFFFKISNYQCPLLLPLSEEKKKLRLCDSSPKSYNFSTFKFFFLGKDVSVWAVSFLKVLVLPFFIATTFTFIAQGDVPFSCCVGVCVGSIKKPAIHSTLHSVGQCLRPEAFLHYQSLFFFFFVFLLLQDMCNPPFISLGACAPQGASTFNPTIIVDVYPRETHPSSFTFIGDQHCKAQGHLTSLSLSLFFFFFCFFFFFFVFMYFFILMWLVHREGLVEDLRDSWEKGNKTVK